MADSRLRRRRAGGDDQGRVAREAHLVDADVDAACLRRRPGAVEPDADRGPRARELVAEIGDALRRVAVDGDEAADGARLAAGCGLTASVTATAEPPSAKKSAAPARTVDGLRRIVETSRNVDVGRILRPESDDCTRTDPRVVREARRRRRRRRRTRPGRRARRTGPPSASSARPRSPAPPRRRGRRPRQPCLVGRLDPDADVVVVPEPAVEAHTPSTTTTPSGVTLRSPPGSCATQFQDAYRAARPATSGSNTSARSRSRSKPSPSQNSSVPTTWAPGIRPARVDLPAPPCPPIPTNVNPRACEAAAIRSRTGRVSTVASYWLRNGLTSLLDVTRATLEDP